MRKKVCHITSAHSRYDVRIFIKQCKSLANNGYDVTLIVNDDKDDEKIDGVNIISTNCKIENRWDRFIGARKKLMNKATEADCDIYQLHDPDLLPMGNKLKRMGKAVIFDSHEDVSRQIKDKEWIPIIVRNAISKTYEIYEKFSVEKYDAVISVTPHIVERFRKIIANAVMVTNYPIVDENEEIVRNPTNAICFAGGIGKQWSHHEILKSIEYIDDIKYILAGGVNKEYLEILRSLPAWEKVEYRGKVSHKEVRDIYSESKIGMALNYSTQAEGQGTLGNTKLFEFMEAKLPVICSNYSLWEEIIEKYKCGICVDPKNVEEIKEAIVYIINNPDEARIMGENGRKAIIEKYNWSTQEKELLRIYSNITNKY